MKPKQIILTILLILLGLVLVCGLTVLILTILYFVNEPQIVYLGEGAKERFINIQTQVELGRLKEATASSYDIMIYDGKFHYYSYIDIGLRFQAGMRSFFASFDMSKTESLESVNELIGNGFLSDLPSWLIGGIGGVALSALASYFIRKAPKPKLFLFLAIGLCALYSGISLFLIHEPYGFTILGTSIVLIPLLYKMAILGHKHFISALIAIPMGLSLSMLFLLPMGIVSSRGLGGLISPASMEQGSWLKAYVGALTALIVLMGLWLSASLALITKKPSVKRAGDNPTD